MSDDVDALFDILDSENETSRTFSSTLTKLEKIAHDGSVEAAEGIAEVYASSNTHRDATKAYFWYHVALASQGHSTPFQNLQETIKQYRGPVGDFRNEAQVSGLLGELGEFDASSSFLIGTVSIFRARVENARHISITTRRLTSSREINRRITAG